jgi:hypothetical protein
MSQEQVDPTIEMMRDNTIFLEALTSVIETSADAETVRIAVSAVTRTESGMNHLRMNPIIL